MAEVTSGNVTVIVLDQYELVYLKYLLENVCLEGSDGDERALNHTQELLDALDVEITV